MSRYWSVFAFLCIVFSAGNAQGLIVQDPQAEMYPLTGHFTAVQVSHAIDCYLSQGKEEALAISTTNPDDRERVMVTIENGVLKIRLRDERYWRNSFRDREIKVYVSVVALNRVVLSGASTLHIMGNLQLPALQLDCSGASDVKGEVELSALTLKLSGASRAKLKGKATALELQAGGASDLNGFDLLAATCRVVASGASDIQVSVSESLDIVASGASSVDYKGSPSIKSVKTSGASSVKKHS